MPGAGYCVPPTGASALGDTENVIPEATII